MGDWRRDFSAKAEQCVNMYTYILLLMKRQSIGYPVEPSDIFLDARAWSPGNPRAFWGSPFRANQATTRGTAGGDEPLCPGERPHAQPSQLHIAARGQSRCKATSRI